ncbi:bifunctional (p)ppGpp synthetase/guanosine-3',5'-bis(diphosphate) 3'-pyrophosphohydrolase [Arenimonas sp.]|uniref:RelA/SpoT family protein n=1 Tax=Arenimonas sp. TaxID=1872635 RepID=UPI002E375D9C|nr:bifunctional (p)ppGpp synthetase/guanosine-3',5'-bis(diphosphate) 3'-pyrophosphohydrolase [Arenimonas sp.]HEX4852569.1 bifunctional (p)ppGpp synthetase/guanosine-3',5'-bis(diphosphate) 3'-pyrophosphohydrolase [Arenimonas sp.]
MSSFTKPQKVADIGPDPCPDAVLALEKRLADYLPPDQVRQVRRAYEIGARAHEGQTRKSGEAYITHPVAVAGILAELRLDAETLCAAILHDALEDTPLPRSEIEREFSVTVAELVDGVTKLDKLHFRDRQEAAAESFRKMMLAMARDLRVILIKLADRLHNMRTLDAMAAESRRRIARETLEIYAPIAQRLGMNKIKAELQDLGFRALHPMRHRVISKRISAQPVMRREALATIEAQMAQRLAQEGLRNHLVSRVKSPWSIYTKMKQENKSLEQVLDVFGFRIVVPTVMQCYHALGAVHSIYKPLDARFRDFIAIPKANGYQSLHTVLFGPYGAPVEVQIRTEDMDLVAERGIAAHWVYKSAGAGGSAAQARAQDWVRNLMDAQQSAGSSLEFLENVKVDLFPDEVYLFTPKGDILALPRNATALDFAYAVHTDVGNHAVAARVDKKLVPLRTKLSSGQSVEVITAPSATPGPQWLEFVVSSKARTAIRHFLKRLEHEDAVDLGHRMLDRALEALESSLDRVSAERIEQLLADLRYRRLEELLADIALGNRMPAQVARLMVHGQDVLPLDGAVLPAGTSERIMITGSERGVLSFAACCHPIPGDEIMGYLSAGKGVVVHRLDCPNVAEYRKFPERCVPMAWDRNVEGDYRVALKIEVENKPGVLAQVAAAVAESNSNIDAVEYRERDVAVSVMEFAIEVRNRKHLADVIRRIRRLGVVHGVQRV